MGKGEGLEVGEVAQFAREGVEKAQAVIVKVQNAELKRGVSRRRREKRRRKEGKREKKREKERNMATIIHTIINHHVIICTHTHTHTHTHTQSRVLFMYTHTVLHS